MLFFLRGKKKAKLKSKKKTVKKKKTIKVKKTAKKTPKRLKEKEILTGIVSHYFPHVKAGSIIIKKGTLATGDVIHIKGHTTNFKQKIKSLEINRVSIEKASKGKEIGILVKSRVRINDKVYKVNN